MPDKKQTPSSPSPDDPVLEQRVDAMMDARANQTPEAPTAPGQTVKPETAASLPPLDIFAGQPSNAPASATTAPELPGKQAAASQPAAAATPNPEPTPLPATQPTVAPVQAPEAPQLTSDTAEDPGIDDAVSDAAVKDIAAADADAAIAAEDAARTPAAAPPGKNNNWLADLMHRKLVWVGLVIVLVLAVFAIPPTRYKVLGLAIKQPFAITLTDSKTNTPVSSADVWLAGKSLKTDANGKVTFHVAVGKSGLHVSKGYYQPSDTTVFVGLLHGGSAHLSLVATGRQVPINVIDKLTGSPVANAEVSVLKTTAKTDKAGHATIVLPTANASESAAISAAGYNRAKASIQVTSAQVAVNTFALIPAGKVYFLSNQSGTIDVVKANLDGSDRSVVLAGTGKEDPNNTQLLANRDWSFVVLQAARDGSQPGLYLIDTSSDKYTEFDSGNVSFSLVGWYGHSLVYDESKPAVPLSQAGHEVLKSYDADRGQLNQLDQNQVDGNSSDFAYQQFSNFFVIGSQVVYTTQWYVSGNGSLSGKANTIRGVGVSGQSKKDYATVSQSGGGYVQATLAKPGIAYYANYNYADAKTTYFSYQNQSAGPSSDVDQTSFNQTYPIYLQSPSGSRNLWSELRDGQPKLFSGDSNGGSAVPLVALDGYQAFGWFSDKYVLVSKDGSQLYIAGAAGKNPPLKITDYYQPAHSRYGP